MKTVAKGLAAISLLLLAAAACGPDKPPPANPETPAASDGGSDNAMAGDGGAAASTGGDGGGGGMAETPPPAKPAALDMPAASAKLKVKLKGKDTEIEIKNDGTVNTAGKPTHKLAGMELQDKDGKGLLKVDGDGNVTQSGDSSAYGKFEGDDLTMNDTSKLSVGDEIAQTDAKGKKTVLGKSEGLGSAKKAGALVVAFNIWGAKPPPAPKGAKPGDTKGKPGDKPADAKKPGDKPAPKK